VHDPGGSPGGRAHCTGPGPISQASILAGMCAWNHAWPGVRDLSPMARARPGPNAGAKRKGCRYDGRHHCRGEGGMGISREPVEAQAAPVMSSGADGVTPQGVELRHLRYFVAVADAVTFTHAAERMFIAEPTPSQQIRRLGEMIGTPLLHRMREGVRLTDAGAVLLEESRTVLSLIDHGGEPDRSASRCAGPGRPRTRSCRMPPEPDRAAAPAVRLTAVPAGACQALARPGRPRRSGRLVARSSAWPAALRRGWPYRRRRAW
jgi:hypothetical protein